jgi:hypothetical protein
MHPSLGQQRWQPRPGSEKEQAAPTFKRGFGFQVAAYRGARLVSLLYAGDSLAGDDWDHRGWHSAFDVREGLFWLAADAALRLPSS